MILIFQLRPTPYAVAQERDWLLARIAEKPDLTLRALLVELKDRGMVVSYYALCWVARAAGGRTRSRGVRRSCGCAALRALVARHRPLIGAFARANGAAPCSLHLLRMASAVIVLLPGVAALRRGRGIACAQTRRIPTPALPATCDRGRARIGCPLGPSARTLELRKERPECRRSGCHQSKRAAPLPRRVGG